MTQNRSKRGVVRWLEAAHPPVCPSVAEGAFIDRYAPGAVAGKSYCVHWHCNRTSRAGQ